MHIYGSFLIHLKFRMLAGVRIMCVFAEVVGNLQESPLDCNESCIANRVWIGLASLHLN